MVDINLLGDDKYQNDSEEESDNFSHTYSTDSKELTSDSHLSDSDLHSYDRSYTRSSSKKSFFIIALIVSIAIIIIAYLLYNFSRDNGRKTKQLSDEIPASDKSATTDVLVPTPVPTIEPDLSPFVRQMVTSTQNGIHTVETILNSIPQTINFTMIQYQDGNFLTEVIGNSSAEISQLNAQLQQTGSEQVKLLSQEQKTYQGINYQQALLNGSLSRPDGAILKEPSYLNVNNIKSDFQISCNQSGLNLKQFEVKKETQVSGYTKVPVFFRAVGTKKAAMDFLADLKNKNLNVNLSKIVLIGSEKLKSQDNINLILNMEVYQPR
ncbi:hypothetical protein JXB12_07910 [candidate division KSB1 bacterium]|nr:hypothetical protein [candidate division KSB1 bacterium]